MSTEDQTNPNHEIPTASTSQDPPPSPGDATSEEAPPPEPIPSTNDDTSRQPEEGPTVASQGWANILQDDETDYELIAALPTLSNWDHLERLVSDVSKMDQDEWDTAVAEDREDL